MTAPNETTDTTIEVQGTKVPRLGFGTWQIQGSDATEGVRDALEIGYRQIDTARAYENEAEVGEGLAQSGVAREEIFLTTKIFPGEFEPDALKAAAENSLRALRTDYLDLLLLHWPDPSVELERTLGALTELREAGLIAHARPLELPGRDAGDGARPSRPCSATRSSTTRSWARTACSASRASATS